MYQMKINSKNFVLVVGVASLLAIIAAVCFKQSSSNFEDGVSINVRERNSVVDIPYSEKLKVEKQLSEKKQDVNRGESLEKLITSFKLKGINLPEPLIESLSKGSVTDKDLNELMSYLQQVLPVGELEFLAKMDSSAISFDEALKLYEERGKITGLNYSQDILNRGQMIYKTANFQQVKALLLEGARLPDDALYKMAKWGNLELAKKLQADGYSLDPTYSNPVTQQNILGAFVEGFPSKYSINVAQQELAGVKMLINMGVEAAPADGGRDALDYAFSRMTPDNVDYKVLMAEELIKNGVGLQKSHVELLNNFKNEYPSVYAEKIEPAFATYIR